jgi:DcuC family C4-dicarboxylate transporter
MLEVLLTLPVVAFVVYGMIKGWYTQTILIIAGFALLLLGALIGNSAIIPEGAPRGLEPSGVPLIGWFFDLFDKLKDMFSFRAAGLGLNIMAVGGFSAYMSHIGASHALVRISTAPMSKFKSPYIVLALGYLIGVFLNMFITSATGLGLLLMATMYPIFRGLGVSKLSAAGVIATTGALEFGPTQSNVIYAAGQAGMDVTDYVFTYQAPVVLPAAIVIALLHVLWQWYMDKRAGTLPTGAGHADESEFESDSAELDKAPKYFALLTMLPLVFVIAFSKVTGTDYQIHIVTAILVSIFISVLVEGIRERSVVKAFGSFKSFLDGMGAVFASVVTLVVAAGIFADGLKQIGVIDVILESAQGAGLEPAGMMVVIVLVIGVSAVLMGSGNASFLSFGELVPKIAERFKIEPADLLLPMQETSSLARTFSPITAVIIAVSGLAKISPFDLVKRTVVPMMGGIITVVLLNYLFFF